MNDVNPHELTRFGELLEAETPEAQAAYLDRVCAGDPDLRARLELLLRAHRDAGGFLGGAASTPGPVQTVDVPVHREEVGAVIGPYKLLQPIGEGGMGTVYVAEQTQPVRRTVALKIIKPGMDSRPLIARFEAERQALALMDHPNIARVLDAGTTASGRPYFVMELVKGVPITKFCDERRLTPHRRLELFVPVCQAVQHAHQKGIIHRDLKPSNVLVAEYDGKPVAKVIDFCIAKATGPKLTERTLFTEIGQVIGTLEYMSPEQAGLNQLDIDTRSDIYSLGVLLYELLTGTTPLETKRLRAAVMLDVLRLIREEEPPKPSTRLSTTDELPAVAASRGLEPKKLSGLVRGELDWIVMTALEKDRNRRYETANSLALDVLRYLRDEPVQACPPSAAYHLRKFVRRHKAGLGTTAVVLLVMLLAGAGVGWVLWDRAARQAARRTITQRTASVALVKAEQLGEQAQEMPTATSAEAAAVLVVWRQAEDALARAKAALTTGAADENLDRRLEAVRVRLERGRQGTERRRARALRKEQLFRSLDAARMAESVLVGDHFDSAGAARQFAAAFAEYGLAISPARKDELARRIGAEEPEVRDALLVALDEWAAAAARVRTTWSAKDLRALAQAADRDAWRQRYRSAVIANDREALRALGVEGRRSSLPPSSLVLLAESLDGLGERDEALALLRWGRSRHPTAFWLHFDLGVRLIGTENSASLEFEEGIGCWRAALALRPGASVVRNNLGIALHRQGKEDEAIAEYRKAIELDPTYASAHYSLALSLQIKKQGDEAIAEFRKAIEYDSRLRLAHLSHTYLGNALLEKKQLDEAIAEYRKAIAVAPRFAMAHTSLGVALRAKKQLNEAIAEFRKAVKFHPRYTPAYIHLGSALRDNKQLDEAIAAFRKACELAPRDAMAHVQLGSALLLTNQPDKAIAACRKAIVIDPKLVQAYGLLAQALVGRGRFAEAKTLTQQALERLPENHPLRIVALQQREQCDRLLALEAKLSRVLAGKAEPADTGERLSLIEVCRLQRRYVAAGRLYAAALRADAKLADDLKVGHRYDAACYAGMAASGQGTDAAKLDDQERTRLRKQALAWLRADLDVWGKRLAAGAPQDRQTLRAKLLHWQRDADLASLRDPQALRKLPAEEQEACRKLWADVAALLRKAGTAK